MVTYSILRILPPFSTIALMLICILRNAPDIAANIAVIEGATLAVYACFSAIARHFAAVIGLTTRLLLMVPLAILSIIFLSSFGASANIWLALALTARFSAELITRDYIDTFQFQGSRRLAVIGVIAEILTFGIMISLILGFGIRLSISIIPWAIAPAILFYGGLSRSESLHKLPDVSTKMLPKLGSSVISAISTYILRISIVLLAGAVFAGDFLTAFGIGGLLPTVYNRLKRPGSIAKVTTGEINISNNLGPLIVSLIGVIMLAVSVFYPGAINVWIRDSFWNATGWSLIAGSIMAVTLRFRFRIQQLESIVALGTDLISNTILVMSIPYLFYFLGLYSLEIAYLLHAISTFILYWRVGDMEDRFSKVSNFALYATAFVLIFPIFFQLNGHIFRDSVFNFDPERTLSKLPIPISILSLTGGILILGNFGNALRSLIVLFSMLAIMIVSALMIGTVGSKIDRVILMAQYLIPVAGLVLGQIYGSQSKKHEFPKMCLLVVLFIVPIQLLCTWNQGYLLLSPYLYIFSIYQHLQYVPSTMVLSYGLAFSVLWPRNLLWKIILGILLPIIAVYTVASFSITTMATVLLFVLLFFVLMKPMFLKPRIAILMVGLTFLFGISYSVIARTSFAFGLSDKIPSLTFLSSPVEKSNQTIENSNRAIRNSNQATEEYSQARVSPSFSLKISPPPNYTQRIGHWSYYMEGILENTETFFLGHGKQPDRYIHPSAHNYYLDIMYNYGLLAIIPLTCLLIHSAFQTVRYWHIIIHNPPLLMLMFSIVVIFIVESLLKVGLRQPYQGIFGFFLLGLLQARLNNLAENNLIY